MFDVLWTVLLGIIGGIISSVIVSRVFMIQGEYQQQIKFVENITRKLEMIAGYLLACRAVFEVSYDEDMRIESEMKKNGYKCEMEYYAANNDKDWISVKEILETFKSHLLKTIETTKDEILNSNITDKELNKFLGEVNEYLHRISSVKELNFSAINEFRQNEKELLDQFENCKRFSGKQLISLIIKDKVMIVLYILVVLIIISTVFAFAFGL